MTQSRDTFFSSWPFNLSWLAILMFQVYLVLQGLFGHQGDFGGPAWAMILLTPPVLLTLLSLPVGRLVMRSWNRKQDSRYERMEEQMAREEDAENAKLAAKRNQRPE